MPSNLKSGCDIWGHKKWLSTISKITRNGIVTFWCTLSKAAEMNSGAQNSITFDRMLTVLHNKPLTAQTLVLPPYSSGIWMKIEEFRIPEFGIRIRLIAYVFKSHLGAGQSRHYEYRWSKNHGVAFVLVFREYCPCRIDGARAVTPIGNVSTTNIAPVENCLPYIIKITWHDWITWK